MEMMIKNFLNLSISDNSELLSQEKAAEERYLNIYTQVKSDVVFSKEGKSLFSKLTNHHCIPTFFKEMFEKDLDDVILLIRIKDTYEEFRKWKLCIVDKLKDKDVKSEWLNAFESNHFIRDVKNLLIHYIYDLKQIYSIKNNCDNKTAFVSLAVQNQIYKVNEDKKKISKMYEIDARLATNLEKMYPEQISKIFGSKKDFRTFLAEERKKIDEELKYEEKLALEGGDTNG